MVTQLTFLETRVLGCLIEKEITTPDQYPLSLNAITLACNQKSNREPVIEVDDATVQDTIHQLRGKRLVLEVSGFGSRVVKYQHRFCNTEFGTLKFSEQALGIVCMLFLRGPQTPGELRTRTNRLCAFREVSEVETVLQELIQRDDGPFVKKMPREPGKRESRYLHLFSDDEVSSQAASHKVVADSGPHQPETNAHEVRIAALEQQVAALGNEMDMLKTALADLL